MTDKCEYEECPEYYMDICLIDKNRDCQDTSDCLFKKGRESMQDEINSVYMREELASLAHNIWIHWMKYLFSQGRYTNGSEMLLPAANVLKWRIQMNKAYNELSELEKNSDRDQADKIINLFKTNQ